MKKQTVCLEAGKRTILCIGAHPDDSEFRCSGTAALFRRFGDTVYFLSVTDGSSGHYALSEAQIRERRSAEARAAAAVIGAESLNLQMPDGRLEPSVANRNMLIGLIRKLEPDLIVTNRLNDYHPDHRYTSQLVQDASYMLMVPRIVPEIPPMRYVPVIAYWGDSFQKPTAFRPDVVVGIDDVLDTKIAMLMRHESQIFEWLPWIDGTLSDVPPKGDGPARRQWALQLYKRRAVPPYADRYRDKLTERYGTAAGSRIVECEAFEISEYGHALSDEQSAMLFGGM